MTKLLCTGDLHLGAHPEYGRAPGDRLRVQGDVLGRILGIAVEQHADAILNLGDTFEGPGIPPEQLDLYAGFVAAADELGIPIVAITGNGKHDAAMRDVNGMQIFSRIPGITVCSRPRVVEAAGVAVACLPWVHPGRLVARTGGGDRDEINREAAELLVAAARGLRAQIPGETPAVLALHGSISGASLPTGLPVDELREPVLDWHSLDALGFDAIVAGHIHRRQFLGSEDSETFGVYVGSPLPLNFGEADCDHGVWIAEVGGPGEPVWVPVESPPFVTLDVDAGELAGDVVESLHEVEEGAVVRVRYIATREQQAMIDTAHVRRAVLDAGAAVVKIVPEIVRSDRARVGGVTEELAPLGAFDLWLQANGYATDEGLRERGSRYLEVAA